MSTQKSQDERARTWTCIVYPDSAPENWKDILIDLVIPFAISPLHDKDVNADGTPKKPHYHVVLAFAGMKSYKQVCKMIEPLNGTIPQICHSTKAITRYFAHLDNPEKAQYDISDIEAYGGYDLAEALKPTASNRYEYIAQMIAWCAQNDIIEYTDLMEYAITEKYDTWFPLLCDNATTVVNAYIRSNRHKSKKDSQ